MGEQGRCKIFSEEESYETWRVLAGNWLDLGCREEISRFVDKESDTRKSSRIRKLDREEQEEDGGGKKGCELDKHYKKEQSA